MKSHADQLEGSTGTVHQRALVARALALSGTVPPAARQADDLRRQAAVMLMAAKVAAAGGDADAVRRKADAAMRLARVAVRRDPVHPLAWAYLADAMRLRGTDTGQAFRSLETSYVMAPVDPDFLAYRMKLAIAMTEHWTVTFLRMLRRDLTALLNLGLWHPAARKFRTEAARDPDLVRLVEILVRRDPDLQTRWRHHAKRIER